jgi:hypothetical protein
MAAMKAAVHYSPQAADLLRAGQIQTDYFKCPAWPDLIETAQALHPVYVHFPLRVGLGNGDAQDTETKALPDWQKIETLLTRTNTPFVNVHLSIFPADYPNAESDPDFPEMLVENTVRDLEAVIRRLAQIRLWQKTTMMGRGSMCGMSSNPNLYAGSSRKQTAAFCSTCPTRGWQQCRLA